MLFRSGGKALYDAAKAGNDGTCRVGASAFTCVSYKNGQNEGAHCFKKGDDADSAVHGFHNNDRINTCPTGCKITYTEISAKWGGDCTKDGDSCKAGCLFVAGTGKGNFAQRTDADTKAFLGEYITNVTAAWKNRTLFDSHIASTNGQAGLQPKVTQATGRCEGALQHWATSADCKKAVKDHGDTKDDASFSADVAGCKHCSSVILNSLTASEAALNTDIKNGYDWSRCLRAMYRKASGGGGSSVAAVDTIWGKNEKCNPSVNRGACMSEVRCPAGGCESCVGGTCTKEACPSCDASFADDGKTPAAGCPLTAKRCERFRTLRLKMPHTFCQFTDAACKTKLKEKMENIAPTKKNKADIQAAKEAVQLAQMDGNYKAALSYVRLLEEEERQKRRDAQDDGGAIEKKKGAVDEPVKKAAVKAKPSEVEAGPFDLDAEVVAVVTSAVEGSEDAQTRLAGGAGTIKYISDVKSEVSSMVHSTTDLISAKMKRATTRDFEVQHVGVHGIALHAS